MDKETRKLILKKGRKYKKWTEGIFLNPFYWVENGVPYYVAVYTKGARSVASAFFTIGEEKKEEAMKAHAPLALFTDLSTNVYHNGSARSKVSLFFYTKPLGILVDSRDANVKAGRSAFAKLLELQEETNDFMEDYIDYYENDVLKRGQITEKDVEKVMKAAITLDMLQYKVGSILIRDKKNIEAFAAYLENQNSWKELDKETRTFLHEITKNTEDIQKNLEAMDLIEDENPKKMFQLHYDRMLEKNKQAIEQQKASIRYPD